LGAGQLYEININGIFQKCYGPKVPELNKVVDWCDGNDGKGSNSLEYQSHSNLIFQGAILPKKIDESIEVFGDWSIIAAANYHRLHIRWQPWRDQVFLPSPSIVDSPLHFGADGQELVVKEGDRIIGRYSDWTHSIRETNVSDAPYQAGHFLLSSKDLIDNFCSKTNFTFCWLVTVKALYKKMSYDDKFEQFSDYRIFGASKILIP